MRPGGDGTSRRIDSAVTLLPQPLSPTIARVSPGMTLSGHADADRAQAMPSRVKNQVLELVDLEQRLAGHDRRGGNRLWFVVEIVAIGAAHMRRERRGSSASRAARRPSRLIASTATDKAIPGKQHDVIGDLKQHPSLGHDVAPARDVAAGCPAPRKDRIASVIIAEAAMKTCR